MQKDTSVTGRKVAALQAKARAHGRPGLREAGVCPYVPVCSTVVTLSAAVKTWEKATLVFGAYSAPSPW